MSRLADKVAIVTGAGRGIGRAIALRCAQEGAHVVVADIDTAAVQETAAAVERLGRRSLALRVDLIWRCSWPLTRRRILPVRRSAAMVA